ncbi:hypothetical protein AB0D60_36535 [Streptomyces sp. NPDC048306]|uniref:hypothetical protein n=1 Tax=Streptomyces sp. NPDC048306 TaxID=3154502 RepID=UPI0033EEB88E
MQGFLVACLNALVANPDGFLEQLTGHWPAEKPRGRPRKATSPPGDSDKTNNAPSS